MQPKVVDRIEGYLQVTDALLPTLAIQRGGLPATLDRRLAQLHSESENGPVTLIPV